MVPSTGPASTSGATVTSENGRGAAEQDPRFSALERRVSELEGSFRELLDEWRSLRDNRRNEVHAAADPRLGDVIAITEEMFGTPEVTVLRDPEDPDVEFVVFTVKCGGEPDEIVEKRIEWHDRIDRVPVGSSGRLRLSIAPIR